MKDVEWHHSAFQQHSVTRRITLRYCGVLRILHAVPQISSSVLRHNTAALILLPEELVKTVIDSRACILCTVLSSAHNYVCFTALSAAQSQTLVSHLLRCGWSRYNLSLAS